MPTYEYRCRACGHEMEAVQAFTDDALTECPSCGASQLRKVFGSVGISFKGSGFYKNDSRSSSSHHSSGHSSSTSSSSTDTKGSEPAKADKAADKASGNGSSSSSSSTSDAKTA